MTRQHGKGPKRRPPATPRSTAPPASGRRKFSDAEAKRRRRIATIGIVFFSTTGIVAATLARGDSRAEARKEQLAAAIAKGTCVADERYDEGDDHVEAPNYDVNPPAGGDHTQRYVSDGVYEPGSVPTDGELVHAQEHGYIVLWYHPEAPDSDVDGLKKVADTDPFAVVVAPRDDLPVPVAATAWHHRLLCADGVDEEALAAFVAAYRDRGPEKGFVED